MNKSSDFDKWLKKEFKRTWPEKLAQETFPAKIMKIITSNHHKSRDGSFSINYDHWNKKWHIAHHGYVREVEVEADNLVEAGRRYLEAIERENNKVFFGELEREVNQKLPKDFSVEISKGNITLFQYEKGEDRLRSIETIDMQTNVEDIVKQVNKTINDPGLG